MKKKILGALAIVLVLCVAVGGTLAYLFDKTEAVVNTFSFGNVDITLTETTGTNYKMLPGDTLAKDPKVTVLANSENAYVFVEVLEENNLANFITYEVADQWTQLKDAGDAAVVGPNGGKIYYLTAGYTSNAANQDYYVLKGADGFANGKVTVSANITETDLEGVDNNNLPKLTFYAYAIQNANIADVNAAWDAIAAAI